MVESAPRERSFIMIKPDGVQRGLVGEIISRFEKKGFKLVGMKLTRPGKEKFEQHYADLSKKPFFAGLVEYANSGPVVAMVWEGHNVVATGRKMLGATRPDDSAPGTIRGDLCIDVGRSTAQTPSILLTRRLLSGSARSLSPGPTTATHGSTRSDDEYH
jgi:nucleoside-diphosphate kinase